MKKHNKPAFMGNDPLGNDGRGVTHLGLTKLEYFAAMAMQGMLANPNSLSVENVGKASLYFAVSTLSELAKESGHE